MARGSKGVWKTFGDDAVEHGSGSVTPIPLEVVRRRLLNRGRGRKERTAESAERARRMLRTSWNWRDRRPKERRC